MQAVPTLQPGQTHSWIGRALAWLGGEISTGWHALSDFLNHKAFPFLLPFLKNIFMDEVAALTEDARAIAKEVVTDAKLIIDGQLDFGAALGTIATRLEEVVVSKAIPVAKSSIWVAAQAALHELLPAVF